MTRILTLGLGIATAASIQAAPRMVIPVSEFDFGYVPQNSSISHGFWLFSNGDDTLRVLKVVPG